MTSTLEVPDAPEQETPSGSTKRRSATFNSTMVRRALIDSRRQAQPAAHEVQPGDVRGRDRQRPHHLLPHPRLQLVLELGERLRPQHRGVAVVHRAVRQLRRSGGRGSWQGAGRHPAQDPRRDRRLRAAGRRRGRGALQPAPARRPVRGHPGTAHPRRRGHRRGDRHRRRVGHHRRVGTGHPGVRRRPLVGHRWHPGAVGPDRGEDHVEAGRDVPRPHDRPGRGGQPAEDPQRDRPGHPAGRPHHRLHVHRGVAPAVLHLLGRPAVDHRAGGPAGLPHPHDHRRPAVGHRHRRHGPAGAAQRPGHVRAGRRGRGRRLDAAARQDRHHHLRQPSGRRVRAHARRRAARAGRRCHAVQPGRRDPRGPLDRGAGRVPLRAGGPRTCPTPSWCPSPPRPA